MTQMKSYRLILTLVLICLLLIARNRMHAIENTQDREKKEKTARLLFQQKKYDQVILSLEKDYPYFKKATQLMLAQALNKQKKFLEESKVLEFIINRNKSDYPTLTKLGEAYFQLNRFDEAIQMFRSALEKNKNYEPALEGLLFLYESTNNFYEARSILKDLIKSQGEKTEYLHKLCRNDSLDGYIESSSQVCLKAINQDPHFPDSFVYLANNYYDQGEKEKAEKAYIKAAKKFPRSEFAQSAAGLFYFKNKDFHNSFPYFKQAVKLDLHSVRALKGLAQSALETGEYQISLQSFLQACRLDSSIEPFFRQAIAQLRAKNNYKWSESFSSQIIQCHPDPKDEPSKK